MARKKVRKAGGRAQAQRQQVQRQQMQRQQMSREQVERQQDAAKERIEKELIAEQVPEKLRTLMLNDLVDSATLRHAVFQRGGYPENTPIANYDPQFVMGSLVASWGKWLEFINENSDIPF